MRVAALLTLPTILSSLSLWHVWDRGPQGAIPLGGPRLGKTALLLAVCRSDSNLWGAQNLVAWRLLGKPALFLNPAFFSFFFRRRP